jgi:phosphate transport system substrate-binding protein
MKRTTYTFLTMMVALLVFCACSGQKSKNARTDTYSSGKMTLMCDESFSPIVEEELAVFHAMYPDAHVTAKYTNEIDAFNALMKQDVHLIITARNLSKKQLEYFKSMKIQPRYFPLGYDGLAFIINKNNVDSCITVKDIKRILSGQATKWNQINKGSKFGTIDVVFDNKQSAAVRWAVDSILGGKPINSPNISAVNTSAEVIKYVEKFLCCHDVLDRSVTPLSPVVDQDAADTVSTPCSLLQTCRVVILWNTVYVIDLVVACKVQSQSL